MVLYGVTTNTSIKDLFLSGIIPGLLLGGAFMVTSYIFAKREGHPVDERFEVTRLASASVRALAPLLIPTVRQTSVVMMIIAGSAVLGQFLANEQIPQRIASGLGQQTPPVASVLLTVCSATNLKIEQVIGYGKWFILSMFVTLMIVAFTPWTALALR